ncbi:MAG: gamma-glutamylcyclotransferase [Pseudomonadota bacterium]
MTTDELWIFGYGSLIWNPEFPFVEREIASLSGFQRRFCMSSIHHRGTEAEPGLVLALDARKDSRCAGVAFHMHPDDREDHLARLRARELISSAYVETRQTLHLADGRVREGLCYVVDKAHDQYVANQTLAAQARQIAGAVGGRGPNPDYLHQTAQSLRDLEIFDADLEWLDAEVRRLTEFG